MSLTTDDTDNTEKERTELNHRGHGEKPHFSRTERARNGAPSRRAQFPANWSRRNFVNDASFNIKGSTARGCAEEIAGRVHQQTAVGIGPIQSASELIEHGLVARGIDLKHRSEA